MGEKIRGHIRSNVIGYVALFVALSGTAYATHPGGANTISSGDIINGEVRSADIASGNVQNSDLGGSAVTGGKIAPETVLSSDVSNETLKGADIENVTRSVNLPLGSFLDVTNLKAIDFDSSNPPPAPDFGRLNGLVIEWDVGADGVVGSTFIVPPDYASGLTPFVEGGSFVLRVSKDQHTGPDPEQIFCDFTLNEQAVTGPGHAATIGTDALSVYEMFAEVEAFAPGDAVTVKCSANPGNDGVRLHGIEFRYAATQ